MDWMLFAIFFAACCVAGSTGMLFSPGDWYERLAKPGWTPPNWLFPVAWSVLYVLIALSAARVAPVPGAHVAIAFWALQMCFNTLWSPVFFGLHRIGPAMIVITGLWLSVFATTLMFFRFDPWAGAMFVPYLLWSSYAGALNLSIWLHNRNAVPA